MLLLRLLSLFLGALTGAAALVLSRLVLGLPLLGALGGRAGQQIPALPSGVSETTVLVAGALAGFVAAWIAPDRPLMHALALGLAMWGVWSVGALFGPPGGGALFHVLLLPVAVVVGGWIRTRIPSGEDPPPDPERGASREATP